MTNETAETVRSVVEPGMTLASYRIERLLGRGGMGAVFLAYDTTLHRQVALKVMDGSADTETSRTRLLREARNAAALNHPNICTIHEVGDANGSAFIAMEYVEGRSLRDRIDQGALPLEEAVRCGIQAADALAYAHDHGVNHRDFKAANAIVTEAGRLKIVDFGLARRVDAAMANATTMPSLVPAGAVAGTPYAMAPEQVRGDATDARADIWGLGVLLYEMVAGAKPFTAATIPELFSSILRDSPAPLPGTVPAEIRSVIDRCLEKEPERRYQQAGEVRAALEAIQTGTAAPWITWRYHLSHRPWLASATAVLGVVAVLVGLNVAGVRDRLVGKTRESAPIKLAVLPFENLTGDPEQEYFSDGLTEEMITQLGRLHPQRLSVIARTSSMRYKNRDTPIDQIGRELNVDYVLEGSVRREGGRVRISATLINVRDQTQRWAESFERELAGILALESDVARGVAGSLALTLMPAEQNRLATARAVNPEAYEAYLKGRLHWQNLTRQELDTAMQYFELALEKDPNYALAYTGIGVVWGRRGDSGFVRPTEAFPKWKAAILKAIELSPDLPEAQAHLAAIKFYVDWDWTAAEREFQRAVELNPSYPEGRIWYSQFLSATGRAEQGVTEMRRAVELDPYNSLFQSLLGEALLYARRNDEAITYLQQILRENPTTVAVTTGLSWALESKQRYDEALAVRRQTVALQNDPEAAEAFERGYAQGGYREAMRLRGELGVRRFERSFVSPVGIANSYARAGDKERAMDWLEQSYQERESRMVFLDVDPRWEGLRDHPRFQQLRRRMNFPL